MTCEKFTIDSNVVGLSFAEEDCIGKLPDDTPGSGLQDGGVWYPLDPNEFDDFGGEVTTLARNPLSASRQRQKGVITDLEATGGFNQDLTQSNLTRIMQGFFFADARERTSNKPINGNVANTVGMTTLVATGSKINLIAGGGAKFKVGQLVKLSGMVNNGNNGVREITAINTDELTVSGTLVNETVSAPCTIQVVGQKFGSGVLGITFGVDETLTLTRSAGSFITDGYQVGEWIFIGGDTAGVKFVNNKPGYARIEGVTALALTLREPTWTPITDTGSGKTIEVYTGLFLRNEKDQNLIKRRTYQLERTLGMDTNGIQSEILIGAVANEFSLNLSTADKLTCDLSFQAMTNELRNGTQGLKPGSREATVPIEDAFNTSSDIFQLRLFIHDPMKATPSSLYAKVMEGTITINNNASGRKAIGTLGSFDINVGDFEVGGEIEAYFATIAAVQAIKSQADVGLNLIATKDNAGFVYDIPLVALGGGRVNVEKDEPIMLSVESFGAENRFGYTISATYFAYLPTAAMSVVV
jgi:hypothetical protein